MSRCCANCEFVFEDVDGIIYCDKCNVPIERAECGWYKIELSEGIGFGMYATRDLAFAAMDRLADINRNNDTICYPIVSLITPDNERTTYFWSGESYSTDLTCFNFCGDE